jgi:hypothetical protein
MTTRPLLVDSAHAEDDSTAELRRRLERVQDDLADAKLKIQEERNRSAKALRGQLRLRQELSGLYRALKGVMEELPDDADIPLGADVRMGASAGIPQPAPSVAYDAWKSRLSPACGKIIDALLVQPLSQTQMISICGLAHSTVKMSVGTLKNNSLVEKHGDKYRLKQL